ncbi:DNA topoisomerase [Plasmodiophora brassicae]
MVVVLNVAEKPSVAKEVARVLSRGTAQQRTGPSPYNPVFEFQFDLQGQRVLMVFTSVLGHVMRIDFVPPYDRGWSTCDPGDLFQAPIVKSLQPTMDKVNLNLEQQTRRADKLVLWLDCDREGENISFEVVQICRSTRPHLPVLRARFSSLIPAELGRACQQLGPLNQALSQAVDVRTELDLRIGAAFTRFQTLSFAHRFSGMPKVLSFGPCQFPTLGFVVARHLQIEAFVPQDYWTIAMTWAEPGTRKTAQFRWVRGPLYDHAATLAFYQICVDAAVATVRHVRRFPTTRAKPLPLSTVPLQQNAARRLRIGSNATMAAAEELYRRGLISYPRTETDSFLEGTDLMGMIRAQCASPVWGPFAQTLAGGRFAPPRQGGHNDMAHPPIHPTQYVPLDSIGDVTERRIYEYVVRHFLACCSWDAQGDTTQVDVELGEEQFECKGLQIRDLAYMHVYTYETWTGNVIPTMADGQRLVPTRLAINESRTAPPQHLSEAELIGLMDRNGIGTDATIAQHIETIEKREYAVKRPDSRFAPTDLGLALVTSYDSLGLHDLSTPRLRAMMEGDLTRIAQGQAAPRDVLDRNLAEMKRVFAMVTSQKNRIASALSQRLAPADAAGQGRLVAGAFSRCGRCNGAMMLREGGTFPRYVACGACNAAYRLPQYGTCSAVDDHLCPLCAFQPIRIENVERGTTYTLCPFCSSESDIGSCLQCREYRCRLAGGMSPPVHRCPTCGTPSMGLRRGGPTQRLFAQCGTCRATLDLPGPEWGAADITVVVGDDGRLCPACQTHIVQVRMDGRAPAQFRHETVVGCLKCSRDLQHVLDAYAGSMGRPAGVRPGRVRPPVALNDHPRRPPAPAQRPGRPPPQQQRRAAAPARHRAGAGAPQRDAGPGASQAYRLHYPGSDRDAAAGRQVDPRCLLCGQVGHPPRLCPNKDR